MKREYRVLTIMLLVAATALAACGPAGGRPAGKTVYVGPYQADCVGVAPQKCLLVKEKPEENWTLFYDQIQGFDYEPGYEYELRISEEKVENAPADASTIKWMLLEVVSKTRSLEGTSWVLESYVNSADDMVDVLPGSQTIAIFQDGQVGGSAGCNSYFGTYEVDGSKITVEVGGMTMMYCPPDALMDQERDYVADLNSAALVLVEEEELRIADADSEILLRYSVLKPTPLVGTTWQLMRYNNGRGGLSSAIVGTEITALFGEDGSLTGSASCNNYVASYEVDGNPKAASGAISISPAATTRKMCPEPEGIMEQETDYLAALQSATAYEIKGDELELTNAEGTRVVTYVAQTQSACPSPETLKNMAFNSEWTESGRAPLTDGEYREQAAPGSATETVVMLTEHVTCGELNGQPAAAVVLVTDPGGSGTFYSLSVVAEQDGQPVELATTALGDRVQINSLAIENNEIVVDMVIAGPNDPLCCPTQHVVRTYALQGNQLVQTSNQVVEPAPGGEEKLAGVVWQWLQFVDPLSKTTVDDPSQYTVEFKPEGQVHVKADCNVGNGPYTTEGSQISIEVMAMTLAMCPPGSLSDQFVAYLNEAVLYSFDGQNLLLDLTADSGTMMFAPAK